MQKLVLATFYFIKKEINKQDYIINDIKKGFEFIFSRVVSEDYTLNIKCLPADFSVFVKLRLLQTNKKTQNVPAYSDL